MKRVCRPSMSTAETAEVWRRWKRGESPSDIGRALGRFRKTVHRVVAAHGGVPPRIRTRSRCALTLAEREEISRGLVTGCSLRRIACRLGRAPSTVSREVRRHGGRTSYRRVGCRWAGRGTELGAPSCAGWRLNDRCAALWPRNLRTIGRPNRFLGGSHGPFPGDPRLHVSHETIYLSLFVQTRGVLKKALIAHLRRRRRMRPLQTGQHRWTAAWPHHRRGLDSRAPGRGGGPRRARSLGRGPAVGCPELAYRDAGRAAVPLRALSPAAREGHDERGPGALAGDPGVARGPHGVPDVGPRSRTGGAQDIYRRHPGPGLLLRSTKSLAAGHEREHQRACFVSTSRMGRT